MKGMAKDVGLFMYTRDGLLLTQILQRFSQHLEAAHLGTELSCVEQIQHVLCHDMAAKTTVTL